MSASLFKHGDQVAFFVDGKLVRGWVYGDAIQGIRRIRSHPTFAQGRGLAVIEEWRLMSVNAPEGWLQANAAS